MNAKNEIKRKHTNPIDIITSIKLDKHTKYQQINELISENNPAVITKHHALTGETCLHAAVNHDLIEIVLLLLKSGANANAIDFIHETPLHCAARRGLDEMVLLLCSYKADTKMINSYNQETALHLAAKNGHLNCIKILLTMNQSCKRLLPNKMGETAKDLFNKSVHDRSEKELKKIFSIQYKSLGRTPLHYAVLLNLPKTVLLLLDEGESVNIQDNNQYTPLHYAAKYGFSEILLILCRHPDINMNSTDRLGETALHKSAKYKHPDCIRILVSADKSINRHVQNKENKTAEDLINEIKDADTQQKLKTSLLSIPPRRRSVDYKAGLFGKVSKQSSDNNLLHYVQENLKGIKLNTPEDFSEQKLVLPDHSENRCSFKKKASTRKIIKNRNSIEYVVPPIDKELVVLEMYKQNKIDLDIEIKNQETKFEEILLSYGLEYSYPISEVRLLTKDDFANIAQIGGSEKKLNTDCLQAVYCLCMGKIDKENLIIDIPEIYVNTISLLIYFKPYEIISALTQLVKHFSNHQNLIGCILVKNTLLISSEFDYDLSSEIFNESFQNYLKNNCLKNISIILEKIFNITLKFKQSSMYSDYKKIILNTLNYDSINMIKIKDRINETINHKNMIIENVSKFLAIELNNITAQFYQKCTLDKFNEASDEKNGKSYVHDQKQLLNSLTIFVQRIILTQSSTKNRARAITLFVLVAKECLHYHLGPDLNSMFAIFSALDSYKITRLVNTFKLLDIKTITILESLKRICNPNTNYKFYRDFSKSYPENLPYLGFILRENILLREGQSSSSPNPFLGNLYLTIINLRNRLEFYPLKNTSDLLFQLQDQAMPSEDDIERMSFLAEPQIPNLSHSKTSCTIEDFCNNLKKFNKYHFPLTVIYNKKHYEEMQALDKIEEWLSYMIKTQQLESQKAIEIYKDCFFMCFDINPSHKTDLFNQNENEQIPTKKLSSFDIKFAPELNDIEDIILDSRRSTPTCHQQQSIHCHSNATSTGLLFFPHNDMTAKTIIEATEEKNELVKF